MTDRRMFLRGFGALTGGMMLVPHLSHSLSTKLTSFKKKHDFMSHEQVAEDEEFWYWVRKAFTISENITNLNSGVVSPQPKTVQDAYDLYNRMSNEAPPLYGSSIVRQGYNKVREKLANIAGCSTDELALNRNTTESLETIIFGLELEKGDEVVFNQG